MRPGAYGILLNGPDILLTFQSSPLPEFQLPGGGIDFGESATTALHREVAEETGWIITKPRKIGAYRRFTYMPEYEFWAEKICHIYLAKPVREKASPSEPFHTAQWADARDAVELLGSDGDAAFLRNFLRHQAY